MSALHLTTSPSLDVKESTVEEVSCSCSTATPHRPNRKCWTDKEKKAFWKQKNALKKERRREKKQQLTAEQQQEWELLSEEEKERRRQEAIRVHERRRQQAAQHDSECRTALMDSGAPRLVFDLSFSWCMSAADTKSTIAQIKFSYSTLHHAKFPMAPVITSLVGRVMKPVDGEPLPETSVQAPLLSGLSDFEGFRKFPFPVYTSEHWSELFPREKIVFLTADAEEVLEDIERDKVYVIGAFVDHNQHKLLSWKAAQRHGVRTARLPIKENIDVSNRCQILTINHVVDLLTSFITNGRNWKDALEKVLPVRRLHQQELGSRKRRRQLRETSEATEESSVE